MFKTMKYASVMVVILGLAGVGFADIIDEFNSGDSTLYILPTPSVTSDEDTGLSNVWGGVRESDISQDTGTGNVALDLNTLNLEGEAAFSTGPSTTGSLTLSYGDQASNGSAQGTDWSGATNAYITLVFTTLGIPDNGFTIDVTLSSGGSTYTQNNLSVPYHSTSYNIALSGFTSADLTDCDGLEIYFNGSNALDFTLERIETTPEPATMALLGVGGIALLFRRRRRNIKA